MKDLIVSRLKELLTRVPEWRERGVQSIDEGAFGEWYGAVKKWLRLGGAETHHEFKECEFLHFCSIRMVPYGGARRWDRDDAEEHTRELNLVERNLKSAIETLELEWIEARGEVRRRSRPSVDARGASQVVIGGSNEISLVRKLTLSDLFKKLEVQLAQLPGTEEEKQTIRRQLQALGQSPLFATLAGKALEFFLR